MNKSFLETDSKPSTRLAPAASVLVALLIAIITLHGRVPAAAGVAGVGAQRSPQRIVLPRDHD